MPLPLEMLPMLFDAERRRRRVMARDSMAELPRGRRPGRLHAQYLSACSCQDPATMQRARDIVQGALEFNVGQAGTADIVRNTFDAAQSGEPGALEGWLSLRRAYQELRL